MNKFVIKNDLYAAMFMKVPNHIYNKSAVYLTDDELQKKMDEYKKQGFVIETYHQEEFGDGMRFVRDGEGLDDIKGMTYKQLKKFTNECKREVEKECRKQIKEGNILLLRNSLYPFYTSKRLFNIFHKYAADNYIGIITFETLLYLVQCTGNAENLIELMYQLKEDGIYIHFLDYTYCTASLDNDSNECLLDYIDCLINEYFLEDILVRMYREKELSDEEFKKYSIIGENSLEEPFDDEEFEKFIGQYE